jgi:hypothetical protein
MDGAHPLFSLALVCEGLHFLHVRPWAGLEIVLVLLTTSSVVYILS